MIFQLQQKKKVFTKFKTEGWKNNLILLKKLNFDNETFNVLKRHRKLKDTLTKNVDKFLKESRIILPEIIHKTSVKLAHIRYQGIQKTKAIMQSKVCWFRQYYLE